MTNLRANLPESYPAWAFAIWQDADLNELWWSVIGEDVRVSVNANDLFYWATSEGEPIESSDKDLAIQCFNDLEALERKYKGSVALAYLCELFACRKRGMRPQGAFYTRTLKQVQSDDYEELCALFDAAGPPRERPTDVDKIWDPVGRE